ncbi:MAG: DegT/DnrJ/EryC1/StrS family aminotransferase [Humibacillus sp.]|nr:DegT/DnrJ/EryC1/StrS family aminotransferase [Humibacillus sp.]MDN5779583.1 DegT/DnrJ/EryC1/StrS family aminotransferase [Humibacillus sp.]
MGARIPVARPLIGEEERQAVVRVLESGHVVQGDQVAAFEHEFADLVDGRECVAVASGTAALQLGLLAAGIGPGDEVIVPSFTFAATANAVRLVGALPVFVDIDPSSFCLEPAAVAAAVTPSTAAIVPVHLFGHVADMDAIGRIAQRHHLLVLEDAAQAHGARRGDRPAGTFGDLAAFSFYATKNMTTGEGGLVATADKALARQIRLLRNQGMERRYEHEIVGLNARMTDLAAAIGRVQLSHLPGWNDARRSHAATLTARLDDVVQTPTVAPGTTHVFHQYTLRHDDRDRLAQHLWARGIDTAVHYPRPVHRMPAYAVGPWQDTDLPQTQRACREVLSLPVHPGLTDDDLDRIVAGVRSFGDAQ